MEVWRQKERRLTERYEVTLCARAVHGLLADERTITSHDIGAKGAGVIVNQQLTPGEAIDISFIMPDNAELVSARGTVVWVQGTGPNRYRAGVSFPSADIQPIPIVLRSIKSRAKRYFL